MYERLLDKKNQPTPEAFAGYCGSTKDLFLRLDQFLTEECGAQKLLRFPYGNRYGWGYQYAKKSKHLCDVFAEKDAFTVMLRLANTQYDKIRNALLPYTQAYIENKYPCGDGGWIHYRVLSEEHLEDLRLLLKQKLS